MDETEPRDNPNPRLEANWISKWYFWWLNPLLRAGSQRPLDESDLYNVLMEDSSTYIHDRLSKEWDKEIAKENSSPSLWRALIRVFGWQFSLWGLVILMNESVKILQPLLLGALVSYFTPGSDVTERDAYLLAAGFSACAISKVFLYHPYFFAVQRFGMWMRVGCSSLIYKKSLVLSNSALRVTTSGQMLNLMSNDAKRFDQLPNFLHDIWISPVQAVVIVTLLWWQVGASSLAGIGLILLFTPIQAAIGKLFIDLRLKIATQTDQRISLMSEILTGIRVVKLYCWENLFRDLVHQVRRVELRRIRNSTFARAGVTTIESLGARIFSYGLILALVLTQGSVAMRSEVVYPALALLHVLAATFFWGMTVAIRSIGEAYTSMRRIEKYLLLDELASPHREMLDDVPDPKCLEVDVDSLTAQWDKASSGIKLKNISLEVKPGQLLAVIGPVGAGKSSLLMTILGELPLTSGHLKVKGKVAYASQQPWVFSATVRQNVTFGQPFNEALYQRVLKATAFTKDLKMLPDGDGTLVGERGVMLSGGQKARLNLARILYYNADIYLLDDPLSAVDATVGRHIFDKCILGLLEPKVRILVTHQLQYIKEADEIIILKEGEIAGKGTFEDLVASGVDFAALLKRDEEDEPGGSAAVEDKFDPCSEAQICNGPRTVNLTAKLDATVQLDPEARLWKSCPTLHPPDTSTLGVDPPVPCTLRSARRCDIAPQGISKSMNDMGCATTESTHSVASLDAQIQVLYSQNMPADDPMMKASGLLQFDFVPRLLEEEQREMGVVTSSVYLKYLWIGCGFIGSIVVILLSLLAQSSFVMSDWWLAHWCIEEEKSRAASSEYVTWQAGGYNTSYTPPTATGPDAHLYLAIFSVLTFSVYLCAFFQILAVLLVLVRAAARLHGNLLTSVLRSPMLFFDTNPSGRILNRFVKDVGLIDEALPFTMCDCTRLCLSLLSVVVLAVVINPWVIIPTVVLAVLLVYTRRYYLNTSRDVLRLVAITRSPVYSHVNATLQGLHTVRALKAEAKLVAEYHRHQDQHSAAWFMSLAVNRWFALRLDMICALFSTAVAFCGVLVAEDLSSGLVGMTLSYALVSMGQFQWTVRLTAKAENEMTSVERVLQYTRLPSEAPLESTDDNKPCSDWPQAGIVMGKEASVRYSADGPLVLKNLNFCIYGKEKVGIVGRTGAGKSSLITMLFRLAEPEGKLYIDGLDISQLGLHDLRHNISIIPQDPVLFTGSIRRNLDPFNQRSDDALWKSLEEVQMKSVIEGMDGQLEAAVLEGGTNFSVGQRQLLCFARAILRQNKILVIDEATANVDPRTDALIQQTIRQKFRNCTVMTIAHRLNTVMDSDRIMVLDEGTLVEFDHPHLLLQKEGALASLVAQCGIHEERRLRHIAKQAFNTYDKPNVSSRETVNSNGAIQFPLAREEEEDFPEGMNLL